MQRREYQAFCELADHFGVEQRLVVDVGFMQKIGGSSLFDPCIPVPVERESGVPNTHVPFRNANPLGIGFTWVENVSASTVWIGVHQGETTYPDCKNEFFEAYNRIIKRMRA